MAFEILKLSEVFIASQYDLHTFSFGRSGCNVIRSSVSGENDLPSHHKSNNSG